MSKALVLSNGVPRMSVLGASVETYDETFTVSGGGLNPSDTVTLPSSGTYESTDLKVFRNGILWEEGIQYDYVGAGPSRTQIELLEELDDGERLRLIVAGDAVSIYDEVVIVPNGGYTASTNITLPSSRTYNDIELQVYLDGQRLEVNIDYNYVGSIPRTQIQTVVDLLEGERLRFRVESN